MNRLKNIFLADENGAVTVDWVVLCAGIVTLAIAISTTINSSTVTLSQSAGENLSTQVFD